jgi:L-ascorbate metabolism protein UlaG (beta-lactamase superfamily)
VKNLHGTAVFAQKSLIYKETPLDNAVHRFTVEGIQMAHMGDAGNRLTDEQIDGLLGGDILLALAEGPPTLEIPDLWDAIQMLQPRIVIPMHFHLPGINGTFLDVEPLAARFSPGAVRRVDGPSVALTDATLPAAMQRIILKSSIAQ